MPVLSLNVLSSARAVCVVVYCGFVVLVAERLWHNGINRQVPEWHYTTALGLLNEP